MKILRVLPLLVVIAVAFMACKNDSTTASQGESVVTGMVRDVSTGVALGGVTIMSSGFTEGDQQGVSDANGKFTLNFKVDSTAVALVTITKTGYRDSTFSVSLTSGATSTLNLGMIPLQGVVIGGTGLAQTIAFLGASTPELSVYGVGGKETAVLQWEVRDSLGNSIDRTHAALLTFAISNGPGGGEYVSPQVVGTNSAGQANMTFNSGTKAGVCQIVATATVNGRTIVSSPVRVVIHGGFPDQAHFTIASPTFNFPALGIEGLRHSISVLVGDKYSNPAAPSAVYFRSTAGVIQGTTASAVTTSDGQGNVDIISGNPAPLGSAAAPGFGDGYHYVVARTIGQGGVTVQDSILLLWSGGTTISNILPPTPFNIPNEGSQTITFNVQDILGHPLAFGTVVNVTATIPAPTVDGQAQNKVFLTFGNNSGGSSSSVTLPDAIFPGPGRTQFTIIIQDGSWGLIDVAGTPVNVTITVSGPNSVSPVSATVSGIVH